MPRYWFCQRTSGYGSTPNTWQGWVFTVVFLIAVFAVAVGADYVIADRATLLWVKDIALIIVFVPSIWFIYAKTEGGWRWHD